VVGPLFYCLLHADSSRLPRVQSSRSAYHPRKSGPISGNASQESTGLFLLAILTRRKLRQETSFLSPTSAVLSRLAIEQPRCVAPSVYCGSLKSGWHLVLQFTNYADLPDGARISVPVTEYTTPSETNVPLVSLEAVKDYIRDHFPELIPFGISYTRLCWYTDSIGGGLLV